MLPIVCAPARAKACAQSTWFVFALASGSTMLNPEWQPVEMISEFVNSAAFDAISSLVMRVVKSAASSVFAEKWPFSARMS